MNIFDAEYMSTFFTENYFLFLSIVFLGTFLTTWYIIPKVIWVSNETNLVKPVIGRSAHDKPIPAFGGVAFSITLILTLSLVQALRLSFVGNHLIAAIMILFMVGLKDDLVVSTARVKLVGQVLAICFLIFSPELTIHSLHGFFGIEEIPAWLGYALASFLLLAIINAYNLIDGIDGLAAITGIIIGVVYATVFYYTGQHFYVLVSMTLVGILCGFIRFNFSRGHRKIFMGDSGSLVIGLTIGFLTLKILNLEASAMSLDSFIPENRILFVLAVLFLPFFDTARCIIVRLLNKKNPFEADRNHTHHILLDAGFTHKQATMILGLFSCVVISLFLILASILNAYVVSICLLAFFGLSSLIFHKIKIRNNKTTESPIGKIIHATADK